MTYPARIEEQVTEWEEVIFPLPTQISFRWPEYSRSQQAIKRMLKADGLEVQRDYSFLQPPLYGKDSIRISFKNPEHCSWYLLKWISSEWFNKKNDNSF